MNRTPIPTIEVNVVPLEGTATGEIVIDASIHYLGIGVLPDGEMIRCTVRGGSVTQMCGEGPALRRLRATLEAHGDPTCYNVAELGIGLNPNARLTGVMLEDEGVINTVHIGIGTSFTLGGTAVAPSHYDLLLWDPAVAVDGTAILNRGEVTV
jgi:leucyl aminopeptidase (aminopeptidase T)